MKKLALLLAAIAVVAPVVADDNPPSWTRINDDYPPIYEINPREGVYCYRMGEKMSCVFISVQWREGAFR